MLKITILAALAASTTALSTPSGPGGPLPTCTTAVEWVHTFADALGKAEVEEKLILAYFWADGSEYSGKLFQETLSSEDVLPVLDRFVCFSAKHGEDGMQELFDRLAVNSLPTMVFLDDAGNPEDLIQGFIPVEDFLGELDRIERGEGTLSGMRAAIAKAKKNSEEDMSTRLGLAGKLIDLGDEQTHDELLESIRRDDPRGRTLTGCRMLLSHIEQTIAEESGGDEYPQDGNLKPLYTHAKAVRLKEGRFEAWDRVGNLEIFKGNMPAAFDAFRTAWKMIPEERAIDWSGSVASWIIENADQLTSMDKDFALDLATACNKLTEKYLEEEVGKDGESSDEQIAFQVGTVNRLAWAYYINGEGPKAIATARRCLELLETEKYRADLETFMQGR